MPILVRGMNVSILAKEMNVTTLVRDLNVPKQVRDTASRSIDKNFNLRNNAGLL